MISLHLAVLNAFLISKPIIAHIRFVHWQSLTEFLASDKTLSMASIVERPFLAESVQIIFQ